MTDQRRIPAIMTSGIDDRAFARASRTEVPGAVLDSVKKTNIAKINSIGDMTVTTLLKYVRAFPGWRRRTSSSQLVDVSSAWTTSRGAGIHQVGERISI